MKSILNKNIIALRADFKLGVFIIIFEDIRVYLSRVRIDYSMKIGVIDSGIGGLSTILTMDKMSVGHTYIYYYDKKNLPYGEKNADEMREISINNSQLLLQCNIDCIVLACNTAATTSLEYLQKSLSIPCFGVTPCIEFKSCDEKNYENALGDKAIDEVCDEENVEQYSHTRIAVVGENVLLCTPLTAKQIIFNGKTTENLTILPQKNLAKLIENSCPDFDCLREVVREIFEGINKPRRIILGCTHYSFIEYIIKQLFPTSEIINGNERVAMQIAKLTENIAKKSTSEKEKTKIYVMKNGISDIEQKDIMSSIKIIAKGIDCSYL